MTTDPDYCHVCKNHTYSHRRHHRCPPRWLVFIGEDACSGWGEPDTATPSDDEGDWSAVYATDEGDAAEKRATAKNEDSGEYYMMNETYPVWVRSFPWKEGDKPKRFNVSAEPSVYYSVNEVE
jgi:hypothetical protein